MKTKTLRELRIEKNFTQAQVSKLLDISIRHVSLLENGDRNPSDKTKEKLAKLYNVSVIDIFLACDRTKRSKKKGGTKDERKSIDS